MKSTLVNITDVSDCDWEYCSVDLQSLNEMKTCQRNKTEVDIIELEASGAYGYYNVRLPSGTIVNALDGYHLSTIHELQEMFTE